MGKSGEFFVCGLVSTALGCTPVDNFLGSGVVSPDSGAPGVGGSPPLATEHPDGAAPTLVTRTWPEPNTKLPNQLVDVLGVTEQEVNARISGMYEKLFHGSPDDEAVYVEVGGGEAYIRDVFNDDTRMDAVGYGMMISVLLNKQEEFDAIWAFAKRRIRYNDGPALGFFHLTCELGDGPCEPEADSNSTGFFGSAYATTALLFADARWTSVGAVNYIGDADRYLDLLETSSAQGLGVPRAFDAETLLPYATPLAPSDQVSATDVIPAFFQFWAAERDNEFWADAAAAGRALLTASANDSTGLNPSLTYFDGEPVNEVGTFEPRAYHAGFHLAVDQAWYSPLSQHSEVLSRQTAFFAGQELPLAGTFKEDGTVVPGLPSGALTVLCGAAASQVNLPGRERLIRYVWESPTPTGLYRYFDGMNHLLSLLFLSGQFHTWP